MANKTVKKQIPRQTARGQFLTSAAVGVGIESATQEMTVE